MTPQFNPDENSSAVNEAARHRCMLYLLGELSDQQATKFEHELAGSEELQSELLAQSDLLCGVAAVNETATVTVSANAYWPAVAAIAALAACVMIAVVNWPANNDDKPSVATVDQPEGLLIAQAWADVSLATTSSAVAEPDDFSDAELDSEEDSSLSWMVAAMEAGAAVDG